MQIHVPVLIAELSNDLQRFDWEKGTYYRYIKKIYSYTLLKSVIYPSTKLNGFENKNCMGVENPCGMI